MKLENSFLRVAVKSIEKIAIESAGNTSRRNWHETKVPTKLLEQNNKKH